MTNNTLLGNNLYFSSNLLYPYHRSKTGTEDKYEETKLFYKNS
jgi:hypothetical protein